MARLKRAVLERLMKYYTTAGIFPSDDCSEVRLEQIKTERTGRLPRVPTQPQTVTSAQIAEALDIDPTQVRKDFSAIGSGGNNPLSDARRQSRRPSSTAVQVRLI